MVEMSIETTGPKPDKVIENIKNKLMPGLRTYALQAGEYLAGEIRLAIQRSLKHPEHSTAKMARSFRPKIVTDKKSEVGVLVASDLVYSRIQDLGGEIQPVRAKALTIPISNKAKKTTLKARDWPSGRLFIWKNKETNKVFLAESKGKKGLILHYVLKDRVRISPKGYLLDALEKATSGIDKILKEGVDQTVSESIKGAGG